MLGGVQFKQGLLQGGGIGCYFRTLNPGAGGGKAGIGDFDPLLDGREFAGFEVGELLFGRRSFSVRALARICIVGAATGLCPVVSRVEREVILLRHPVFPLCIVSETANVAATIEAENGGSHARLSM